MGTLKDILLGPETSDPSQVRGPFESFGAGLGGGFGAGFAKQADPEEQRKKKRAQLDEQKTNIDNARALVEVLKNPDRKTRVAGVELFLNVFGEPKDSPARKYFLDIAGNDSPEVLATVRRALAAHGAKGEGFDHIVGLFRTDPAKGLEYIDKLTKAEGETTAAGIRSDVGRGVSSESFDVAQGIQGQELSDPRDLSSPLDLARQRATSVRGEAGEKLRGELSLGGVPSERLEPLLTARAANQRTGVPSIDALTPQQASSMKQTLLTKPGVVGETRGGQEGDKETVSFFDKGGKLIAKHTVGDLKENIGTQLVQKGGKQRLVTYNKRTGKELGSIDAGDKPIDLAHLMADFASMAEGNPPIFGNKDDYPEHARNPELAKSIMVNLMKTDPFKAAMGSVLEGIGEKRDFGKDAVDVVPGLKLETGKIYRTKDGRLFRHLGKDNNWPLQ